MPISRCVRLVAVLAAALSLASDPSHAEGAPSSLPTVPLPEDAAKDLKLFGEGVVGEPIPAPRLEDLGDYYLDSMAGTWSYEIVSGERAGKVQLEIVKRIDDHAGNKAWRQQIGDEFVQYIQLNEDGSLGKYGEDDLSVNYGAHFHPGIFLAAGLEPGESKKFHTKVLAYKLGDPNDTSYTGTMDTTVGYVGAYRVTTPAGTWPCVLTRAEFDVKIGPAKVQDVAYAFFAKDVGKVAEVEALRVSALFVYHSDDKTAKVLKEIPEHLK